MASENQCFICDEKLNNGGQIRTVKKKGIDTFIAKSKQKNDDKWKILEDRTEVLVHERCRMNYNITKKSDGPPTTTEQPSEDAVIDPKTHCFFCGKMWAPKDRPGRLVMTQQLQENIEKFVELRNDEWAEQVKERIEGKDLAEAQARYHAVCYNKFTYVPTKDEPEEPEPETEFGNLCNYMEEHVDRVFLLTELLDKMEGVSITAAKLKEKLMNKYGNDIITVEKKEKPTIVCFRKTGYKVFQDAKHQNKTADKTAERIKLVRAAGCIVREDIHGHAAETSNSSPESAQDVQLQVPETLSLFLDTIFAMEDADKEKIKKRDNVARSIIEAVCSASSPEDTSSDQENAKKDEVKNSRRSRNKKQRVK